MNLYSVGMFQKHSQQCGALQMAYYASTAVPAAINKTSSCPHLSIIYYNCQGTECILFVVVG